MSSWNCHLGVCVCAPKQRKIDDSSFNLLSRQRLGQSGKTSIFVRELRSARDPRRARSVFSVTKHLQPRTDRTLDFATATSAAVAQGAPHLYHMAQSGLACACVAESGQQSDGSGASV